MTVLTFSYSQNGDCDFRFRSDFQSSFTVWWPRLAYWSGSDQFIALSTCYASPPVLAGACFFAASHYSHFSSLVRPNKNETQLWIEIFPSIGPVVKNVHVNWCKEWKVFFNLLLDTLWCIHIINDKWFEVMDVRLIYLHKVIRTCSFNCLYLVIWKDAFMCLVSNERRPVRGIMSQNFEEQNTAHGGGV